MTKYERIVFIDGSEGFDTIERFDLPPRGVWINERNLEAIAYLAQWDSGDGGDVRDEPAHGPDDAVVYDDGYILSWSTGLGHIGLERIIDG